MLAEVGVERALLVGRRGGARPAPARFPSSASTTASGRTFRSRPCSEAAARAVELEADGLVGLGGGSAIDTCKAVAAELASQSERAPRIVAVPTTYAGAEWTPFFGMLLEPGRKGGGMDERAPPVAAIYDPELTLDLPLDATVGTAMNALAHCAEAYYHPAARRAPLVMPTRARPRSRTRCRSSSASRAASTARRVCSRARCGPRSRSRESRPLPRRTRWHRRSAAATGSRRGR